MRKIKSKWSIEVQQLSNLQNVQCHMSIRWASCQGDEELEAAAGEFFGVCFASLLSLLFFTGVGPLSRCRSRTRFTMPGVRSPAPVDDDEAATGFSEASALSARVKCVKKNVNKE